MGFYQEIEHTHGIPAANMLRRYNRSQAKLASLKNRRSFLLRCRKFGLYPNHITHRTRAFDQLFEYHDARTGQLLENFNLRLVHKVLSMEISVTIKNLNFLTQRLAQLGEEISQLLPQNIWIEFRHRCTLKFNREFHNIRDSNRRKFDRLLNQQVTHIPTEDSWFKNISTVVFPDEVAGFLALGPKFSLQPSYREVSIPRMLAEIESIRCQEVENRKPLITAKITNIITNWAQKQQDPRGHLHRSFTNTSKFLKQHPEVIITQADKGNVTVALNVDDYRRLSDDILSDEQYYVEINRDPTSTFQQKANKLVSELKRGGMIDDCATKRLSIYNARPARFYGLPKIHKPILSLRPIISSIQCPNSNIAQLVTDIMTEAYDSGNDYHMTDSFKFSEFINNFELPNNFVLVSFDVTSLFTNIPVQLVTDSISRRWNSIQQHTNITKDMFLQLLTFIFQSTYFTYDNRFFKQIFGTPMGSVVSPIIAQYVMDDFLDVCLPRLPFKMPFIKKYVDDIICAVPENEVDSTLQVFNSIHQNIQFTVERETNHAVPFLDTLVIRENGVLRTDWYSKPTASGRYINFKSFHTTKMKINTVLNMKNRVIKLSHPLYRQNNMGKLYDIMVKNSFPHKLLNKLLYSTPFNEPAHRQPSSHTAIASQPETPDVHYRSLPFVDNLSRQLMATLSTVPNLRIALRNIKTVRDLYTPLKDRTPVTQRSGVVYSIPCNDCDQVYIGQTARTLQGRITSHKSDIRTGKTACQLSVHSNRLKHSPNFHGIKILDTEPNTRKRLFLEMVRISQEDKSMNTKRDIDGLSTVYTYLLQLDKERRNRTTMETTIEPESPI